MIVEDLCKKQIIDFNIWWVESSNDLSLNV
jgi:hypothetical protein